MKILLRKVTQTPSDFVLESDTITFKGYLQYHDRKLTLLHAELTGEFNKPCDVCAEDVAIALDEEIEFFLSDGVFDSKEDENALDVVECLDGEANLDEILHSEIELIRSDYHICKECENKERAFEF